jgi:hypothetical protein
LDPPKAPGIDTKSIPATLSLNTTVNTSAAKPAAPAQKPVPPPHRAHPARRHNG